MKRSIPGYTMDQNDDIPNIEFPTNIFVTGQPPSNTDNNLTENNHRVNNSNRGSNTTDRTTDNSSRTIGRKILNFFKMLWHCLCCCYYLSIHKVQNASDEECNHSQQSQHEENSTPINSPKIVNVHPKTASSWIDQHIFQQLDQTVIINPSSFIRLNFPQNIFIPPGATFLAHCSDLKFHEKVIPILVSKGFYPNSHGQFTLNEEVNELYCPTCKQRISNNNPVGIGFRDCVVTIKYRDTEGKADQFNLTSDKDTFAFAKFSQHGNVKYNFIKFNVDYHTQ